MGARRLVILLDTNVLVRMLVGGTAAAEAVSRWIAAGESLGTSAVCWYEFESGPVDAAGLALASTAIMDRILPFTADHAREAARLWNAAGRVRRRRVDAMIAAVAVVSGARLATSNVDDFRPFGDLGLAVAAV